MFARIGHAAFNTFEFNENGTNSDSVRLKDFNVVASSVKSMAKIAQSIKTFGGVSENEGKPFVEVGG